MDAYLAIVSKREVRFYEDRPLPYDVLTNILEAGRVAGSSKNAQPWTLIVMTDRDRLRQIAPQFPRPGNLEGCAAAVAVVLFDDSLAWDAGRAAQNMMLAAWALGVGSCPNTVRGDFAAVASALQLPDDATLPTIITFGYPAEGQPHPPRVGPPERILAKVKRRPLSEIVHQEVFKK